MKGIQSRVEKFLSDIRDKELTAKQLITLYNNFVNSIDQIPEEYVEEVSRAFDIKMREAHPRQANKIFGSKDSEAQDFLQRLYDEVCSSFDLSENRVGNGVKLGGSQRSGKCHIDWYVSYKNSEGWHAGIGYIQETPSSEPYLRVRRYLKGESNAEGFESTNFGLLEATDAQELYKAYLREFIAV